MGNPLVGAVEVAGSVGNPLVGAVEVAGSVGNPLALPKPLITTRQEVKSYPIVMEHHTVTVTTCVLCDM